MRVVLHQFAFHRAPWNNPGVHPHTLQHAKENTTTGYYVTVGKTAVGKGRGSGVTWTRIQHSHILQQLCDIGTLSVAFHRWGNWGWKKLMNKLAQSHQGKKWRIRISNWPELPVTSPAPGRHSVHRASTNPGMESLRRMKRPAKKQIWAVSEQCTRTPKLLQEKQSSVSRRKTSFHSGQRHRFIRGWFSARGNVFLGWGGLLVSNCRDYEAVA